MLIESLSLTLMGGLLGFGLAAVCVKLMSNLLRFDMPSWMKVNVDHRALIFTIVVSVTAGALAGLVPALRASKPDLNETLKEGGKSSSGGGNFRARRLLAPAAGRTGLRFGPHADDEDGPALVQNGQLIFEQSLNDGGACRSPG